MKFVVDKELHYLTITRTQNTLNTNTQPTQTSNNLFIHTEINHTLLKFNSYRSISSLQCRSDFY